MGFDGTSPWLIPRSRRAVTGRFNLVSTDRRSYTYETRLLRYSERGFCVAVPGLDLSTVAFKRLQLRPWINGTGLPRLLAAHPRMYARDVPLHISNQQHAVAVYHNRWVVLCCVLVRWWRGPFGRLFVC